MRILSAVVLVLAAGLATAQTAFQPAAIVNDEVVTYYDVEQRARLLVLNGAPNEPELRQVALEQLIEDKIRVTAAERFGVAPEAGETASALEQYAAQRGIDVPELRARIEGAGADFGALEDALGVEQVWRRLIQGRFGSRAQPSEAEIERELALAASGETSEYRLAEIGLPATEATAADVAARAEALVAELRAGADFAALALRESRAPSAPNGGDVGWVPAANLPPAILDALAAAAPGDVIGPIAAGGGFTILRLDDVRSVAPAFAGEVTLDLVAFRAEGGDEAQAALAAVEGPLPCGEAVEAAADAGVAASPTGPTPLGALPAAARVAVASLAPGDVSQPVPEGGGFTAYLLCSRRGGPGPEVREEIAARLRSERLVRFADGYLQELRGEAVIELR